MCTVCPLADFEVQAVGRAGRLVAVPLPVVGLAVKSRNGLLYLCSVNDECGVALTLHHTQG